MTRCVTQIRRTNYRNPFAGPERIAREAAPSHLRQFLQLTPFSTFSRVAALAFSLSLSFSFSLSLSLSLHPSSKERVTHHQIFFAA